MSQRQRPYCDARGFIVDALSHGNPGNTEPTASGYSYHITESGKFETGPFSMQITGLKPGTKYYYRACAHNAAGWSYGDEVSFATKKAGTWKKIRSYLEFNYLEVGFPLGIKARFKRKGK
jgi:hypothetical protein